MKSWQAQRREQLRKVQQFNARNPIGTPVRYWTGLQEGAGKVSRTRTEAQLFGNHTAVVWVEDEGSCIALSHVAPISPAPVPA